MDSSIFRSTSFLLSSHLFRSLVLPGEAASRIGASTGNNSLDCRLQAGVYRLPRMYAAETNIFISRLLFLHASDFNHMLNCLTYLLLCRGDVLNTTVYVGTPRFHELFPINRLTSFGRTVIATLQHRFVPVDWVSCFPFWPYHFSASYRTPPWILRYFWSSESLHRAWVSSAYFPFQLLNLGLERAVCFGLCRNVIGFRQNLLV